MENGVHQPSPLRACGAGRRGSARGLLSVAVLTSSVGGHITLVHGRKPELQPVRITEV